MNLFVLVSTGQKVSNLPPVLEHTCPGDHMLWVESPEARRQRWTAQPLAVLEAFGLVNVGVVSVDQLNDPSSVAAALAGPATTARGQYEAVYLVANGGQKLTPFGLVAAFRDSRTQLLYGDDKPAVWSLYPAGFTAPPTVAAYTRHQLDLPQILQVNGRTFATGSQHRRVWPDDAPTEWNQERYGIDEPYTADLHAAHFARANVATDTGRIRSEHLARLAPELFARWQRSMRTVAECFNPQNLTAAYYGTLKLDESARAAAARTTLTQLAAAIGPAFEVAVARRVRAWAEAASHPALRSIWIGVKVALETNPHTAVQELDILLVLTNGVLIHLECKSAEIDARDLDTRTLRLRESGSSLARTVCVLPLYTRYAGEPWFAALHRQRAAARERGLTVLDFTMPGQPDHYPIPDTDPPEPGACPSFESALDGLVAPYGLPARPPAGGE